MTQLRRRRKACQHTITVLKAWAGQVLPPLLHASFPNRLSDYVWCMGCPSQRAQGEGVHFVTAKRRWPGFESSLAMAASKKKNYFTKRVCEVYGEDLPFKDEMEDLEYIPAINRKPPCCRGNRAAMTVRNCRVTLARPFSCVLLCCRPPRGLQREAEVSEAEATLQCDHVHHHVHGTVVVLRLLSGWV